MPTFLTARWRHLVMLNYAVDPALLAERVPAGTTLDLYGGRCWVSVVGFLFLDTRVLGVPVPGHRDFEELNLRFYVRRDVPDERRGLPFRRGVVFVKELVPRVAVASVARLVYHEPYEARPMRHAITRAGAPLDREVPLAPGDVVAYGFRVERWGEVRARVAGPAAPLVPGTHAHFIAEHYWGYTPQPDGGTAEYEVTHPPWDVYPADEASLSGDLAALYGEPLAAALDRPPDTALVAVGSEIAVLGGERIEGTTGEAARTA